MGKIKGPKEEVIAMNDILDNARSHEDAFAILEKHGLGLIDVRLWEVLEDMPIGLEDLIEDDIEEYEED